ncbi:MAG TPA: diguanylate cyclase [Xanthomonadales bacterium]|nr:diguanylate cyclase [Xanthomonadales bacterium]
MRPMRALGLGLGAIAVAAGIYAQHAGPLAWTLLFATCFAWPHVAWEHARRSADPVRAELANLQVDAVLGGAWVAAMGFNVLPSVLLLSMLWMGDIGAGGWRLLARAVVLQAIGAGAHVALNGLEFAPHSSMLQVAACVPFLVVYPLAMSVLVRSLTRRVARQNRQLEDSARIDPLTGVATRQHFERMAMGTHARALATGGDATLLMIDVDGFKSVNDREGHLAGDALLAAVGGVLGTCVRAGDTAARYAGDEFAVVVDGRLATGLEIGERIRAAVAALPRGDFGRRCSVSIGAAEVDASMPELRDWIHAADQALYRSKRAGRDRVTAASSAVVPFRRVERPA